MPLKLLGDWERLLVEDEARRKATDDLRLIPSRLDLPRVVGKTRHLTNETESKRFVRRLYGLPLSAIAIDSEYRFEKPDLKLRRGQKWTDIRSQRPICVSVCAWITPEGNSGGGHLVNAVFDVRRSGVVPQLEKLLRLRVPFIFHHAKVDLFTLWALGIDPEFPSLYDTFLAAASFNLGRDHRRSRNLSGEGTAQAISSQAALERRKASRLSLVGQCHQYGLAYPYSDAKDDLRDKFLQADPGAPLDDAMIRYASADAEWTLRLYVAQQADLLRHGLSRHLYSVEFPFALANARMEWRGVHVDPERRDRVRRAAENAADHYATELHSFGIDPPGSGPRFLNLMRREGLAAQFHQNGKERVTDELLERCDKLHPAIRAFRLHRRYRRLAAEEWLRGTLTGADGRTHPNHRQLGADTGRNSCSTPNIVGIGRVLRPVVTAPPGRGLIEIDYSQVEVGVAAAEHDDPELIAAYNSGDVYAAAAQGFYAEELNEEERALSSLEFKKHCSARRDSMKPFVLAVMYNIQAQGLATELGTSVDKAEDQRSRFLGLYPDLARRLEESVRDGFARRYASTVSGLRRKVERRGRPTFWTRNFLRNTPIQGSAAVVFKDAVVQLDRAFRGTDVWIVLLVHDAVVLECPRAEVDDIAERAAEIMKDALRAYYPELEPQVEVNNSHPDCWNKDGHADSLDRFLAEPSFRLDGVQGQEE